MAENVKRASIFGDEESYPTKFKVREAEAMMSEPEATWRLVIGITQVADAVRMVGESGLTEAAIVMLIQQKCGRVIKGNYIAEKTISMVLNAAASLDTYLTEEARTEIKAKKAKASK